MPPAPRKPYVKPPTIVPQVDISKHLPTHSLFEGNAECQEYLRTQRFLRDTRPENIFLQDSSDEAEFMIPENNVANRVAALNAENEARANEERFNRNARDPIHEHQDSLAMM